MKPSNRKLIWFVAISLLLALAVGLTTSMLPHERKKTTTRAHPFRPVTPRPKPPPRITTLVRPRSRTTPPFRFSCTT